MHAVGARRRDHQVNVVWHQAVRMDLQPESPGVCVEQAPIRFSVPLRKKDAFAVVAALRNVVWKAWKNNSSLSWHRWKLAGTSPRR